MKIYNMCKVSILFSQRVDGKDWVSSFISRNWWCVHTYGSLHEVEFWEYKHYVINRIPYEELIDFRDNIKKDFKNDDIDFLLITHSKYEKEMY